MSSLPTPSEYLDKYLSEMKKAGAPEEHALLILSQEIMNSKLFCEYYNNPDLPDDRIWLRDLDEEINYRLDDISSREIMRMRLDELME